MTLDDFAALFCTSREGLEATLANIEKSPARGMLKPAIREVRKAIEEMRGAESMIERAKLRPASEHERLGLDARDAFQIGNARATKAGEQIKATLAGFVKGRR